MIIGDKKSIFTILSVCGVIVVYAGCLIVFRQPTEQSPQAPMQMMQASISSASSAMSDARSALGRMEENSRVSQEEDRKAANDAAFQLICAWARGQHGKVMALMTRTCATTYGMNGPYGARDFIVSGITAQNVRVVKNRLTSCTSDRAVYSFVVQRGYDNSASEPWTDFNNCDLILIKEDGQWRVDSCDSREIPF